MDCSTPGFLVHHQLPEHAQIQTVMPSNYLILCRPLPLLPSIFPALGSFLMSQFFASGGQSIGASASASVLPMNIQDWFPLLLTGLISLQFKGLSRVFSNTIIQKHQFFGSQLSSWSHSHIYTLSYFLLIKLPWINDHNTAHLPVLVWYQTIVWTEVLLIFTSCCLAQCLAHDRHSINLFFHL